MSALGEYDESSSAWKRSSFCGASGACIEVRHCPSGLVHLRDSKDRDGPELTSGQPEIAISFDEFVALSAAIIDGIDYTGRGISSRTVVSGDLVLFSSATQTILRYTREEVRAFAEGARMGEFALAGSLSS